MKNLNYYLDEIKNKNKLKTDYQLKKLLNIHQSNIKRMRDGKSVKDMILLKVSIHAEVSYEEIALCFNAQKEKKIEDKKVWESAYEKAVFFTLISAISLNLITSEAGEKRVVDSKGVVNTLYIMRTWIAKKIAEIMHENKKIAH